jgi:hypothetical protein
MRFSFERRIAARAVGALLLAGACAFAQKPAAISADDFRATVSQMQALSAACAQAATACDATKVSTRQQVGGESAAGSFAMDWGWLRDAVKTSHDAKPEDRQRLMQASAARLAEMQQELGSGAGGGDFAKARGLTNTILAGKEFAARSTQETWWQRATRRFWEFLGRMLNGLGSLGTRMPWLGMALEVLLFAAAGAGLMVFVFRSLGRQKLRVSLSDGAAQTSAWDRESEDWARLAEASAESGEWREAVHGLYWAAIVHLEARRAWRHNPARTPREYVRLLKEGSEQQRLLRGLTQLFERAWYGLTEPDREEYSRARAMFDGLAANANSVRPQAEGA